MGAVILVVAIFFLVFAYNSSGMEKSFDRVDGILVGSDVRMSGVKVGIVTSLFIDPKTYLANMSFSVDDNISLPSDTSIEIVSSGLLGDKYLAVVPGGDESLLKDGDKIVHTQSSVSLEAMIGQVLFSNKEKESPQDESLKDKEVSQSDAKSSAKSSQKSEER
jgi:phospholipid/cholesterol/gamma-HCH transport system substrate-binding protein